MPNKRRKKDSVESLLKSFMARVFPLPPSPMMQQLVEPHIVALRAALEAGDVLKALRVAYGIGKIRGGTKQWTDLYPDASKERKRAGKQITKAFEEKTAKQIRVSLAREIFAEYAATDLKRKGNRGGRQSVYKEIGEIMAQRLGLSKPISADTVRREYLPKKKTGEG